MHDTRAKRPKLYLAWGLAACLLGTIVFWNALQCGFVWDDYLLVEQNQRIRHLANIPGFFATDYVGDDYQTGIYRPVVLTAFTLEYALFGADPVGFHAAGLLFHGLNVLLVYLIGLRLLRKRTAAWIAAVLFAVHPVQSETVVSIAGQAGLLSNLFGLSAWYVFGKGIRRGTVTASLLLLSMLSKESGIVWAVPLLAESILFDPAGVWRNIKRLVPIFIATAIYLLMRMNALDQAGVPQAAQTLGGEDLATRAVTMLRGYAHYMRLIFYPATLSGDYSPDTIRISSHLDRLAWTGLVLLAITLAAFAATWKRHRPAALGLLLFFAGLAPVSNILFPIGNIIAERFLYLPLTGFFLFAGAVIAEIDRRRAGIAVLLAMLITIPLGIRSMVRTQDWMSHEAFMDGLIEAVPRSYRAKEALAERHLRSGEYDAALQAAREARAIFPDRSLRLLEARILKGSGRLGEAIQALQQLLREYPRDRRASLLLGETLYDARRFGEAYESYRVAGELFESDARAWIGMGRSLDQAGRKREAADAYSKALAIRPDLPDAAMRLGVMAMDAREYQEALQRFGQVSSGMNVFGALILSGNALEALGRIEEAEVFYGRAAVVETGRPEPWVAWGELLLRRGDPGEARVKLEKAISIDPSNSAARKLLAVISGR